MNYGAIVSAQLEQYANPKRSVVNSEHAFVVDKLRNIGLHNEAQLYWTHICNRRQSIDDPEINRLVVLLDGLSQCNMPQWGIKGT